MYYTCIFCTVEPIRPIDPSAWVQQTNQMQAEYAYGGRPFTGSPTLSTMTSNSSPSVSSSVPESERMSHTHTVILTYTVTHTLTGEAARLTITTPMYRIAKMLSNPSSGLDVKDRVWLKMPIPKSFIGQCAYMYNVYTRACIRSQIYVYTYMKHPLRD